MGFLGFLGDKFGFTSDRADNPYQGIDRGNYNLPGYANMQGRDQMYGRNAMNQQSPQLGPTERAQTSDFRGDQRDLAGYLMAQARGQGSVAQEQLRQAADQNIARQMAMASTGRGNAALQGRTAAQMAGNINQGMAGQAAVAGLQERMAASQALGGVLQGARGQDEGLGMFNADQGNRYNLAQANLDQNQFGMNNAAAQGWMGLEQQGAGMQQQGGMNYEQNRGNRFMGMLGLPTSDEQMWGGIGSAIGLATGGGKPSGAPGGSPHTGFSNIYGAGGG